MINLNTVQNVGLATAGLIISEKFGPLLSSRMPGPSWIPGAVVGLGGLFLGSRSGMLGKIGYGVAVTGLLHTISSFTNAVDVDFGSW